MCTCIKQNKINKIKYFQVVRYEEVKSKTVNMKKRVSTEGKLYRYDESVQKPNLKKEKIRI